MRIYQIMNVWMIIHINVYLFVTQENTFNENSYHFLEFLLTFYSTFL